MKTVTSPLIHRVFNLKIDVAVINIKQSIY